MIFIIILSFPLFVYVYYFYFPYLVLQNFECEIRNSNEYTIINKPTPMNPLIEFENYSLHVKMKEKTYPAHFIVKYKRIQYSKFFMWYVDFQSRYDFWGVKADRKIKERIELSITNEIQDIGNEELTITHMENKKNKSLTVGINIGDYTPDDLMKYIEILQGYLTSDNSIKQLLSYH